MVETINNNKLFTGAWAFALLILFNIQSIAHKGINFKGIIYQSEYSINRPYDSVLKSIFIKTGSEVKEGQLLAELSRPSLKIKINEIKSEINQTLIEYSVLKNLHDKNVDLSEHPFSIKLNGLKSELELLVNQEKELFIYSPHDGVVADSYFQRGEGIKSFLPILSLLPHIAKKATGYIDEKMSSSVKLVDIVSIKSLFHPSKVIEGVVFALGNRIIELPIQLKAFSKEVSRAREVFINLKGNGNEFLYGEKIIIELPHKNIDVSSAFASSVSLEKEKKQSGKAIQSEDSFKLLFSNERWSKALEPSGASFLKQDGLILTISDDVKKNRSPNVFLIDPKTYKVIDRRKIKGIDSINDMEAMALDEDGRIYISSSLSKNKKNRINERRSKLIRFKSVEGEFIIDESINLYLPLKKVIENLAEKNANTVWNDLYKSDKRFDLNIEGIFVLKNDLYFGLRNPNKQFNDKLVIFKISNIDDVFKTKEISLEQLSLWKDFKVDIQSREDRTLGISDLFLYQNKLFILTSTKKKGKSYSKLFLSSLDEGSNSLEELKKFKKAGAEAITYNPFKNEFVVFFDLGNYKEPEYHNFKLKL